MFCAPLGLPRDGIADEGGFGKFLAVRRSLVGVRCHKGTCWRGVWGGLQLLMGVEVVARSCVTVVEVDMETRQVRGRFSGVRGCATACGRRRL